MKLTYFSQQTFPKDMGGGSKLPRVSFNKAGLLTFNNQACALIGLKAGDKITLAQDPDEPINWFVFKDSAHGFEVRAGYKDQGAQFNHITLSKAFLEAIDRETGKTHNFKIAGQATVLKGDKTEYWGILV